MNYAHAHYIGDSQTARTKKTEATARTAKRLRPMDAEKQRCRRGAERQAQVSACGDASNGFLTSSFLPKLHLTKTVQACQETEKMQKDFYTSLCSLAEHYGIVPMPSRDFEYPYNMALALWDLDEKLKQKVLNCPELRVVQQCKRTYLISEEKYSTGTTLYYIPIEPLYQMGHDRKRRKNAQLLISVQIPVILITPFRFKVST